MPDFERFDSTVSRLEARLLEHRQEMQQVESDLRDNQKATVSAKKVARTGVIVGILGGIVGLLGVAVGVDGRETAKDVDAVVEQRAVDQREARVSGCVQQNVNTKRNRDALVGGLEAILDLSPATTNEEMTRRKQIVTAYKDQVEDTLRYRDCSDKGITAYFESPPQDPAVKEGTG